MANELEKTVQKPLLGLLAKYKGSIETVLPKHLTPERVLRLVVGQINRTPKLLECTPMSVINCALTAATLGLEIRPGSAYLVPFKNKWGKVECNLFIDYRGKIELARRSGQVTSIEAHVVHANDKFDLVYSSTQRKIEHTPLLYRRGEGGAMLRVRKEDRGEPVLVYGIAWLKDGSPHFDVMTWAEVDAIRQRSPAAKDGPWVTDWEEMAKKTMIHRLCKMLPQSPELAAAQEIDDRGDIEAPLPMIIDVDPEDAEGAQPILESSAEAAAEVRAKKLAALKADRGEDPEDPEPEPQRAQSSTNGGSKPLAFGRKP